MVPVFALGIILAWCGNLLLCQRGESCQQHPLMTPAAIRLLTLVLLGAFILGHFAGPSAVKKFRIPVTLTFPPIPYRHGRAFQGLDSGDRIGVCDRTPCCSARRDSRGYGCDLPWRADQPVLAVNDGPTQSHE